MKKHIIIVLTLFLVPMLFSIGPVPRAKNRVQEQVITSIKDTDTQVLYQPRGGERHQPVLFVEDPGGTHAPSSTLITSTKSG